MLVVLLDLQSLELRVHYGLVQLEGLIHGTVLTFTCRGTARWAV